MDKRMIERLEELVEEISECYTSVPAEIVEELNKLTKNEWSENEYIEYCAEYWSRSTLEETVYALLHDGEYPDNIEEKLAFWKNRKLIDMPDEKVMFKLMGLPETEEKEVIANFDDLPVREFYNWFKLYFSEWSVDTVLNEDKICSGSFEVTFDYENMEEYAKYKYIILKAYGNKLIKLICCNLHENEKKDIISFANNYGLHLYEC